MGEPEHVIFSSAFESLRRALGALLDPRLRARFKSELGVDFDNLNAAYPLATWNSAVRLTQQVLFPDQPDGERRVGAQVVTSYVDTMVGSALFAMLRLLGPRRALARLTRNLRTSNNFSETSITEEAPNTWKVWINQIELPHFDAGLLESGLINAGAKGVKVEVLANDASGTTYRVGWTS
jgi:uncharacterized protein (TIGR02265 family)